MRRLAVAAFAAVFAVATVSFGAPAAPGSNVGRWSIASRGDDTSHVQLRMEYSESSEGSTWNSSWSSPVPIADAGITAERLRAPIGPVTFQIQREPGVFSCTGSAGEGSGAGQFTYAPNARFDDALNARGLGRPTFQQSLSLAIAGTTLAFVDQIHTTAQHATVADVVRVVQHGVTPRYVAELAAFGYKTNSLDQLVRLSDHGVRERFISELAEAGYKNLSTEDLIALRDHGVSAAFVARLKSHGYTNVPVRDLIRMRDAGI
jgi:hypothetical protein